MLEDVPKIFEAVFQCTLEVGVLLLNLTGHSLTILTVSVVHK